MSVKQETVHSLLDPDQVFARPSRQIGRYFGKIRLKPNVPGEARGVQPDLTSRESE